MSWYFQYSTSVKWGSKYSTPVFFSFGVRQSSILTPILFSVFIDDLLRELGESNLGCHVKHVPLNIFMYADDLVILTSTISDLQAMVNIAFTTLSKLKMKVNEKKSACMRVGPLFRTQPCNITIGS